MTIAPLGGRAPGPAVATAEDAGVGGHRPFRLDEPLRPGVTLLEASAGTGKTYTIASLAVRHLAQGTPIDRLLVVTFTRSATGELRDRVRSRLLGAEEALRDPDRAASAAAGGDELIALLAEGGPVAVERRRRRLAGALADFDAATITTIHGFCQQVLDGLGTAADCGRDLRFVDGDSNLIDEVVDDFYLRKFAGSGAPELKRGEARTIVAAAVADRDACIEPTGASVSALDRLRVSLAERGRAEVVRRARAAGTVDYDDRLHRLRDSLTGPSGPAAVRRLRARFGVVLVDEFQDTDPVQWQIFRAAFAGDAMPLLLIGDPKQAIYSFRGADVLAYLDAAASARAHFTLGTNWRSDQPLLDAVNAVLDGASLGHADIAYRRVVAAAGHFGSGIDGAPSPEPFRLRLVHRGSALVDLTKRKLAQAASGREMVAADLADEVVALLSSAATVPTTADAQTPPGSAHRRRPVAPGDLAVLVRANHEAGIIHAALAAVGVPAVIAGGGSVFAAPAASDWRTLLESLEQPAAVARARAAALTPFLGWDPARLVSADGEQLDGLQATLHRWASVLDGSGVAALMSTIRAEEGVVARQLASVGGERLLTDLSHIAELLHAEALSSGAGTRALTGWLRERITDAEDDAGGDERSRRLDSDAAAVQILTVHRSKGLEFPVVYLPYMWVGPTERTDLPRYHDPQHSDRRTLDVGAEGTGRLAHTALADEEQMGEDLRQAYVALTRARHQVTLWWVSSHRIQASPLARLLLGRLPTGEIAAPPAPAPKSDDEVWAATTALAARAPGCIAVERVGPVSGAKWCPTPTSPAPLEVGEFTRLLDTAWRRASYTAITAGAHGTSADPLVGSEPEVVDLADEVDVPARDVITAEAGSSSDLPTETVASPMATLPAGAAFGITVHSVLESVDFAAPDIDAAVVSAVASVTGHRPPGEGDADPAVMAGALRSVIETPLGPVAGGRRLRDVRRSDRLDELGFELPLVGGDAPAGDLAVADIAAVLKRSMPAGDPLGGYPARLEDPEVAQVLRGYLTGSIDLILRCEVGGDERYVVVDYKTNWLAPAGEDLTSQHYHPAAMAEAMVAGHYPLQAVLYSVALHRYLRWRKPGYEPGRHLGGILYLFVRGMAGPATPVVAGAPFGVFGWRPPPRMVVELSDLFDSGRPS